MNTPKLSQKEPDMLQTIDDYGFTVDDLHSAIEYTKELLVEAKAKNWRRAVAVSKNSIRNLQKRLEGLQRGDPQVLKVRIKWDSCVRKYVAWVYGRIWIADKNKKVVHSRVQNVLRAGFEVLSK